jgi:ubiquinone/menaquinone biosynthesis C-methylase UbiE
LVPPRRPAAELLDGDGLSPEEIEESLSDIRFVHRYLGGYAAAEREILPLLTAERSGSFSLLDVGCGCADLSLHLARKARQRGVQIRIKALDLQISHLVAARRICRDLPAVSANVFSLPFADRSFDWVLSSLFFHHFSPEENARILREMARLSRRAFFVLDLSRHRIAHALIRGLGPLFFSSQVSIHDGSASVAQAYTREEMEAIAARAGLSRFNVRRVRPFRLSLVGRP